MSTRSTFFYEEDGFHVYHEYMDPDPGNLWLEYSQGGFTLEQKLPAELAELLIAGRREASRQKDVPGGTK